MSNQDSKKQPSQSASYSDLFERLRDYSVLLDPHSHVILESNPACDGLSGAGRQLVGAPVANLVEPNDREEFEKSLRIAMRRHHSRQFDSRWVLPDSRVIHVDVLACPLQLSSGSTVLQVIARDVSFQREAEAKMKKLLQDLKVANTQLEVLSTHDGMTGLSNFRHFRAQLEQIHERSGRYNRPYAILFCDIDHFKKYNDRNGHPAGDSLLKSFATILKECCRKTDLPARYGGEEFVVICPEVDADQAAILADRICTTIAKTAFLQGEHQPLGRVSVSVGVASFPLHGATADDVLEAADQAVFNSKETGRDRVSMAKPLVKKAS